MKTSRRSAEKKKGGAPLPPVQVEGLAGATAVALTAKYLVLRRRRNWKEANQVMATIKLRMRVEPSDGRFPIRFQLPRTPFSTAHNESYNWRVCEKIMAHKRALSGDA